MDFLSKLHMNLTKHGFSPGHTNTHLHPLSSFTKEEGSSWHVVLVIDMSSISFEDFISINGRYTRFYSGLSEKKRPTNIYITNILVIKEDNPRIESFVQGLSPFSKESINNIYWCINLSTGNILLNKNNPTEILNLRKILQDSYQNKITSISDIGAVAKNAPLTLSVIIVNILVFIIVFLNGGINNLNLLRFGALFPYLVFEHGQVWRIFTAMFLHGNFPHLFMNMFSLYILGRIIERFLNKSAFITIFMVSGITASLFSLYLSRTLSVGASGAIFGMSGAIAVMAKMSRKTLDGLHFNTLLIFITINLLSGFMMDNVDNWGHIGGLAGGIIAGFIICRNRKYKK